MDNEASVRGGHATLALLGVGAMNSPRYPPAGLLVSYRGHRVMFDGGPGAEPTGSLDAWLVTDDRSELIRPLRRLAVNHETSIEVAALDLDGLQIEPRPVVHTSHPCWGYLISAGSAVAAWAPEFWVFPEWAAGVDLLFADAAGWRRPIRFAGGVGGHLDGCHVAEEAAGRGVRRLVFAHIGRPSLRAIDNGERPSFGEWGTPGRTYRL